MEIILDTSSLIRFFSRGIEDSAVKIKLLLETQKVITPEVVFAELECVLINQYECSRYNLIDFTISHLSKYY